MHVAGVDANVPKVTSMGGDGSPRASGCRSPKARSPKQTEYTMVMTGVTTVALEVVAVVPVRQKPNVRSPTCAEDVMEYAGMVQVALVVVAVVPVRLSPKVTVLEASMIVPSGAASP